MLAKYPLTAFGILGGVVAVSVKHVLGLLKDFRAGGAGVFAVGIDVIHINVQAGVIAPSRVCGLVLFSSRQACPTKMRPFSYSSFECMIYPLGPGIFRRVLKPNAFSSHSNAIAESS